MWRKEIHKQDVSSVLFLCNKILIQKVFNVKTVKEPPNLTQDALQNWGAEG